MSFESEKLFKPPRSISQSPAIVIVPSAAQSIAGAAAASECTFMYPDHPDLEPEAEQSRSLHTVPVGFDYSAIGDAPRALDATVAVSSRLGLGLALESTSSSSLVSLGARAVAFRPVSIVQPPTPDTPVALAVHQPRLVGGADGRPMPRPPLVSLPPTGTGMVPFAASALSRSNASGRVSPRPQQPQLIAQPPPPRYPIVPGVRYVYFERVDEGRYEFHRAVLSGNVCTLEFGPLALSTLDSRYLDASRTLSSVCEAAEACRVFEDCIVEKTRQGFVRAIDPRRRPAVDVAHGGAVNSLAATSAHHGWPNPRTLQHAEEKENVAIRPIAAASKSRFAAPLLNSFAPSGIPVVSTSDGTASAPVSSTHERAQEETATAAQSAPPVVAATSTTATATFRSLAPGWLHFSSHTRAPVVAPSSGGDRVNQKGSKKRRIVQLLDESHSGRSDSDSGTDASACDGPSTQSNGDLSIVNTPATIADSSLQPADFDGAGDQSPCPATQSIVQSVLFPLSMTGAVALQPQFHHVLQRDGVNEDVFGMATLALAPTLPGVAVVPRSGQRINRHCRESARLHAPRVQSVGLQLRRSRRLSTADEQEEQLEDEQDDDEARPASASASGRDYHAKPEILANVTAGTPNPYRDPTSGAGGYWTRAFSLFANDGYPDRRFQIYWDFVHANVTAGIPIATLHAQLRHLERPILRATQRLEKLTRQQNEIVRAIHVAQGAPLADAVVDDQVPIDQVAAAAPLPVAAAQGTNELLSHPAVVALLAQLRLQQPPQ